MVAHNPGRVASLTQDPTTIRKSVKMGDTAKGNRVACSVAMHDARNEARPIPSQRAPCIWLTSGLSLQKKVNCTAEKKIVSDG